MSHRELYSSASVSTVTGGVHKMWLKWLCMSEMGIARYIYLRCATYEFFIKLYYIFIN